MFPPVLVFPNVGTVSLYLWAMSSSIQGISAFIGAFILVLIFIVVQFMRGKKEHWNGPQFPSIRGGEGSIK
jgi:hypothetical protein